jgi:hypothetical protein
MLPGSPKGMIKERSATHCLAYTIYSALLLRLVYAPGTASPMRFAKLAYCPSTAWNIAPCTALPIRLALP